MSREESLQEETQAYLYTHTDYLQVIILKCLIFAIQYRKNERMINKILLIMKKKTH